MGIVVVVAESYREDLDWKRWIRREKRGYGSFYVYPEGHGVSLRRREESATFLRCYFLLSFRVFGSKSMLQNVGPVLPLLYS